MKSKMGVVEAFISLITPRRRFSNSPLTPAPASRAPISRPKIVTPLNTSGTSPSMTLNANPSTTAVLPTPGSPTQMGLFLRRLARISTI